MSKNALEQVRDKIVCMKETVYGLFETIADHITHGPKIVALTEKVGSLEMSLAEAVPQIDELKVDMQSTTDFKDQMESFSDELTLFKKAIGTNGSTTENRRVKVLEPKPFASARNAKELKNLLWDMEQYFSTAHIPIEERVTITSMYLSGDAKLWWRTKGASGVVEAGSQGPTIYMAAAEALVDFKVAKAENNDAGKPKNNNKGGSKKGKKKSGDGDSPHRAHDFLKKEKLNALVGEEERKQAEPSRVNPLQLLNAIQNEGPSRANSFLYVKVALNRSSASAMVDTGATHNFVAERVVPRLGLSLTKGQSLMKAMNSKAKPNAGMANNVTMRAKVAIMPHLGGIFLGDKHCPCFVPKIKEPEMVQIFSALQINDGLRKGHLTILATLVEAEHNSNNRLARVQSLLGEFADVMPPELP
ncbi:gag-asp_proteas domain-containing protein [Cinnamomum micranthum f. kanehirae]|uniref:Gag-asp_proteas domain-containing protein n=1 Tax=Cinnamomum micranthum f. kanehirae TaxID=337451 RepID=A0A443NCX9_9MAGN|nr:gag-asp_proteas domain-containing protein [Cinnamomum micranthum f. kanehirae]